MPDTSVLPGNRRVDLRSAASGAAIELDNIYLGRKFKTTTITQLFEFLESDISYDTPSNSIMFLITPSVIVMDRVVRNRRGEIGAGLNAVVKELQEIIAGLRQVAARPGHVKQADPELIKRLKRDCLDISRAAASFRRPAASAPRSMPRS